MKLPYDIKKNIWYWFPPMIWMAFIFPIGNHILSSSIVYEVFVSQIKWLMPNASHDAIGMSYIVFRKCLHFVTYAILAYLLYRGFRGENCEKWKLRWGIYAGIIAINYGLLDEFLQSFIPTRNSSVIDFFMDISGIIFILGIIFIRNSDNEFPEEPVPLEE